MTKTQKITLSPSLDIPFNKLVLSQPNVRCVKAGVAIELAESIAKRTLLQSFSVRAGGYGEAKETGSKLAIRINNVNIVAGVAALARIAVPYRRMEDFFWESGKRLNHPALSLSRRFRQSTPIRLAEGILEGLLFAAYATLRSGEQGEKLSRVDQIVEWFGSDFEGVIVFDESHAMQNPVSGKRVRVMGTHRIELSGFTDTMCDRLRAYGLFGEIISWKLRMLVPTDTSGVEILASVPERYPIERITERQAA